MGNVIDENILLTNNIQVVRLNGSNEIDEPAPSASNKSNQAAEEEDISTRKKGIVSNGCNIDKKAKLCLTHGCKVNVVEVTSRKWQWLPKKREYGNTYKKVKKFVCRGDKCDDNQVGNPANNQSKSKLRKPECVEADFDKSCVETTIGTNHVGNN